MDFAASLTNFEGLASVFCPFFEPGPDAGRFSTGPRR
jgi:hypothetical protein